MENPNPPLETSDSALTKAERKRLRRAEKNLQREREQARHARQQWTKRILPAIFVVAVLGYVGYKVITAPTLSSEGLVSKSEVHWHARVNIKVRGEDVAIPANIGIPVGQPTAHPENMHTHAEDHVIHIEKLPPVYEKDLKLGNFFTVWGKQFNSQCVVDECAEEDGRVRMTVNGQDNTQFENYLLRDGDQIEIVLQ
jgi:hypothetical protein